MDHLIRVEVLGPFDIVSVVGYREEDEVQFDGDVPRLDADGQPVVKTVRVPVTEDVKPGGYAFLDPAETKIRQLVRAGLVRLAPAKPAKAKAKGDRP